MFEIVCGYVIGGWRKWKCGILICLFIPGGILAAAVGILHRWVVSIIFVAAAPTSTISSTRPLYHHNNPSFINYNGSENENRIINKNTILINIIIITTTFKIIILRTGSTPLLNCPLWPPNTCSGSTTNRSFIFPQVICEKS